MRGKEVKKWQVLEQFFNLNDIYSCYFKTLFTIYVCSIVVFCGVFNQNNDIFPLCNNLDQLYMVVRYVHCTYEISKVSYKIEKTPKVWDWAYTPLFNNILYKQIAAHFLLHKLILFSQKKECTVHSQFPKLYQMISKYKSRTICLG